MLLAIAALALWMTAFHIPSPILADGPAKPDAVSEATGHVYVHATVFVVDETELGDASAAWNQYMSPSPLPLPLSPTTGGAGGVGRLIDASRSDDVAKNDAVPFQTIHRLKNADFKALLQKLKDVEDAACFYGTHSLQVPIGREVELITGRRTPIVSKVTTVNGKSTSELDSKDSGFMMRVTANRRGADGFHLDLNVRYVTLKIDAHVSYPSFVENGVRASVRLNVGETAMFINRFVNEDPKTNKDAQASNQRKFVVAITPET